MTQNPEQKQIDDGDDVTSFMLPKHVNGKVVDVEGKTCVIIGKGGTRSFQKKDEKTQQPIGEPEEKLYVDVEFPSGRRYDLRLTRKNIEEIVDDIKSTDRKVWVGAKLKLTIKDNGGFKWVEATVISHPNMEAAK